MTVKEWKNDIEQRFLKQKRNHFSSDGVVTDEKCYVANCNLLSFCLNIMRMVLKIQIEKTNLPCYNFSHYIYEDDINFE